MSPARWTSLIALVTLSALFTPTIALPVATSLGSTVPAREINTPSSLMSQNYFLLVHNTRALGGFYSQPHEESEQSTLKAVQTVTTAELVSTVPITRPQATSSSLSPTPVSKFDFSYLHTPSPVAQKLNSSNQLEQKRLPAQAVVIACVLAGVFLLTFTGFIILNPGVIRACCGEPKKRKSPKPQCTPPPSWMRVLPPTDEEFMNRRRQRNAFSFQRVELGWRRKSKSSFVDPQPESNTDSDAPINNVVSKDTHLQTPESVISEITATDVSSTTSPCVQVVPQEAASVEPKFFEPVYHSYHYKKARVLYDVKEEEEPAEERASLHFQSPLFSGRCRFSQIGQTPMMKNDRKHLRGSSLSGFGWCRLSFGKEMAKPELFQHRKSKSDGAASSTV